MQSSIRDPLGDCLQGNQKRPSPLIRELGWVGKSHGFSLFSPRESLPTGIRSRVGERTRGWLEELTTGEGAGER